MSRNRWNVGEAKQQFSEVLRRSEKEPQLVYRRDELIAVIVHADDSESFTGGAKRSLADQFAEARQLLRRENYRLTIPSRRNRRNTFAETLDGVARRHKRSQ